MRLLLLFVVLSSIFFGCNPNKKLIKKAPKVSSITEKNYKDAVVVNNSGEEYKYLKKKYPGYKMLKQSLLEYNFKGDTVVSVFDLLYFQSTDQEVRIQLFNISSFIEKEFEKEE